MMLDHLQLVHLPAAVFPGSGQRQNAKQSGSFLFILEVLCLCFYCCVHQNFHLLGLATPASSFALLFSPDSRHYSPGLRFPLCSPFTYGPEPICGDLQAWTILPANLSDPVSCAVRGLLVMFCFTLHYIRLLPLL